MVRLVAGEDRRVREQLVGGNEKAVHRASVAGARGARKPACWLPCYATDMNLFSGLAEAARDGEEFLPLVEHAGVRIERIVTKGQTTPPGEWYDQAWAEWVLIAEGAAELTLEGPDEIVRLERGDTLFIPARRRHRVSWTDPDRTTVWLAVHWPASNQSSGG
jgi:cupin 2 domain-containing protein